MPLSPDELLAWAEKVKAASELDPLIAAILRNPLPQEPRDPFKVESECHGFEPHDLWDRRPLGGGRYYTHTDFIG